jgi:hypothetical protein
MSWADQWWDEERGLLWNPPGSFEDDGVASLSVHRTAQSAWYAVDLLGRGENDRARRVIDELVALQYDEPGTPWHGTFARVAESPRPREGAIEWVHYDPNWRQFIGTTFRLIELTFGLDLHEPIELAIAGEPPDRVSPGYSNIALMRAWLEQDETLATQIFDRFARNGCFDEYGSPTYYGIDLYALALWRVHPPTPRFRELGVAIEHDLWRDLARWYHAGLRNLCGPYSRAYGMDMSSYVALLGLWLPHPVVPDLDAPFEHSHDLLLAPVVELLGRRTEPLPFETGLVSQRIDDDRVATGWLGDDVMMGGEDGGRWRAQGQYHPATVHWASPSGGGSGKVAWLRVRSPHPIVAAVFEPGVLEVAGTELALDSSEPFPGTVEETEEGLALRWPTSR